MSDPTTDKAAAAMDVNVGHMSDPWELPGLAHFLEHMLFLGTDKYPDENSYSQYISQHGGSNNAYTASDHTNYYFDITPEFLPEEFSYFCIGLSITKFMKKSIDLTNCNFDLII